MSFKFPYLLVLLSLPILPALGLAVPMPDTNGTSVNNLTSFGNLASYDKSTAFGNLTSYDNLTTFGQLTEREQERSCVTSGWATFFDDDRCLMNGGQAVSLMNPGCLAGQARRRSVYIVKSCISYFVLISSPGDQCNCQYHCGGLGSVSAGWWWTPVHGMPVGAVGGCFSLLHLPEAKSYRFVDSWETPCGPNNC